MTYESIRNLGKGTRFKIPWSILEFFLFTLFYPRGLGTQVRAPMLSFFPLYFFLHFSLNRTKTMWDRNPTTSFTFHFSLLLISLLWPRDGRLELPQSLFNSFNLPRRSWFRFPRLTSIFFHFLNSPSLPIGRGFDSHASHFFNLILFTLLHYLEVMCSIATPHISFFFINSFLIVRSWV